MELFAALALLRRSKIEVAVALLVALGVGLLMFEHAASSSRVATATAHVMLDTPESQLIDSQVVGADSLAWRASVLADLMGETQAKRSIARTMGLDPAALAVLAPHLAAPEAATPLSVVALPASTPSGQRYAVAAQAEGTLPLIVINTTAPDSRQAASLARAAIGELKAAATPPAGTKDVQRYVVESTGPIRTRTVMTGSRRIVAPIAALLVFLIGCLGTISVSRTIRARRSAGRGYESVRHGPASPAPAGLGSRADG